MKTSPKENTILNRAVENGIQLEWHDNWGHLHAVDETTCRELLDAMGVSESGRQDDKKLSMDPVKVIPEDHQPPEISIRIPERLRHQHLPWRLLMEDGNQWEGGFHAVPDAWDHAVLRLESMPPAGYHRLEIRDPESDEEVAMRLIITPAACYQPCIVQRGRVWGPAVQLYAVHSKRNWGMGDFGDLQKIIDWAAGQGASLIGLNPLHALFPHNPAHASPYSPSSRMFFNIFYLDVEAMADFAECDEARQLVFSPVFQEALNRLREEPLIDYSEAGRRKLEVLELLYQSFRNRHISVTSDRAEDFNRYVQEGGRYLERFALYQALQGHFHKEDAGIWGWPAWPEAYRNPDSPAVHEFAEANRERIGFYQYLQWQTDIQLHAAGVKCLENNLGIGLYMDMAVGVNRGGADVWAGQHLFAGTAGVGAPPDDYNQKGQNWDLPPWIPERMREEGYASFIEILRQNMKYAGALRMDHVMGLMRLFWIPPGGQPDSGAYVHYPMEDLFGILALESHRNQCMVIGEDMGTVPDLVRERMRHWGIYSYKVFYFEKEGEDAFRAPAAYEENAAMAVSTHDLPTLAGFWEGRDIALRTELDLYPNRDLKDKQIKDRMLERVAMLSLLEQEALLPPGMSTDPMSSPTMTPELACALHALTARCRSRIFMVQFEDMLQQPDPINLPGTVEPAYPNWRRKLALPLEDLITDERVRMMSAAISMERPHDPKPMEKPAGEKGSGMVSVVPQATYRFQFHKGFTFRQAAELVPYLSSLGITHCYASPLLKAREGSQHGYDITDHRELNSEIGTREEFDELTTILHEHGMGLILDIVPNHMGAGKDNPWWMDVLENGPSSLYSDYFDIDWHPLTDDLQERILLPILGDSYGKILENGELVLSFEAETGRFWLHYYEHLIPLNPVSYPLILRHRLEILEARLGRDNTDLYEYQSICNAFEHLPVELDGDLIRRESRARERIIALNRLVALCGKAPEVRNFIAENIPDFQPKKDDPTSLMRMNRLLEQQSYRLANWRVASDEINYRRFFDVNDLVAVRVEDPRVFNDTHALIMELIEKRQINGLRIDHPDGLFDPAVYFGRLQHEAAKRLGLSSDGTQMLGSGSLPFYVLIEKILAPFERLPEEWQVHGTTGYEFANLVNGVFIRQESEKEMTRLYERLLGRKVHFDDLVYMCKRLIMKTTLNSELGVLAHQLSRIAKRNWSSRDFTLHILRDALIEVIACFPVYRTYVSPDRMSRKDREYIDWAVRTAKRRSTASDTTVFDFIQRVLLLEIAPESGSTDQPEKQDDFSKAVIRFTMKFQQYTGPVMAKGLEDTSFYRYNRLVSLNEVGGEPKHFGVSLSSFHHQNIERARRTPHTLLSTSTHDTKRSEDVRARISVLSEIPHEWQRRVSRWRRMNRNLRRMGENGEQAPAINAEYLFYQSLLGVWPFHKPTPTELETIADRMEQYMLKAAREAKSHTSWINPHQEYEAALSGFVRGVILRPSQLFMDDFLNFHKQVARYGMFNSLSQTVLKLTCPGVPDIYQGSEFWDFSLVDPDNRRPVDYPKRMDSLNRLPKPGIENTDALQEPVAGLMENWTDGRIKQYLVSGILKFRCAHPDLFSQGDYQPVEVAGAYGEHVIAFVRRYGDEAVLVAVPRLLATLGLRRNELPCGRKFWKDTAIILPDDLDFETSENVLSREAVMPAPKNGVSLPLGEILRTLPVGVFHLK